MIKEPVFVRCPLRVWSLLPYHEPVCLLNPAHGLWEQEGAGGGGLGAMVSDRAKATGVVLPLRSWRATAWRMPCQAALCKIPESCLFPNFGLKGWNHSFLQFTLSHNGDLQLLAIQAHTLPWSPSHSISAFYCTQDKHQSYRRKPTAKQWCSKAELIQ